MEDKMVHPLDGIPAPAPHNTVMCYRMVEADTASSRYRALLLHARLPTPTAEHHNTLWIGRRGKTDSGERFNFQLHTSVTQTAQEMADAILVALYRSLEVEERQVQDISVVFTQPLGAYIQTQLCKREWQIDLSELDAWVRTNDLRENPRAFKNFPTLDEMVERTEGLYFYREGEEGKVGLTSIGRYPRILEIVPDWSHGQDHVRTPELREALARDLGYSPEDSAAVGWFIKRTIEAIPSGGLDDELRVGVSVSALCKVIADVGNHAERSLSDLESVQFEDLCTDGVYIALPVFYRSNAGQGDGTHSLTLAQMRQVQLTGGILPASVRTGLS